MHYINLFPQCTWLPLLLQWQITTPLVLICVIVELYLTSRRKSKIFSHSAKWNTFSKFEFIALKFVSATFLIVCFFKFKEKHFSNWEKYFLFHFRSSFCCGEDQILEFYIFKLLDISKTRNTFHWVSWEGNTVC